MLVVNRFRRCKLCKGREVLDVEDDIVIESSLTDINVCKKQEECKQNIEADNTEIGFHINEKGKIIGLSLKKYGKEIFEVDGYGT